MRILKGLSEEDKERIAIHRDEKCFKHFFIQNFNALQRYADGIIQDRQTAEDLVSESMWKLWHLGQGLMKIHSPEAYLFRSVRNACLNYLRSKRPESSDLQEFQDHLVDMNSPEQLLITAEAIKKIENAIAGLPPKTRQAFRLVKEERRSYKEVAEYMGISVKTVDRHIQIALEKLGQALSI